MPSLLGRFLGLTFRTELLIMNILGLINSTLDWSPLKWTNKLEQIWNFSMPQKSLIVDTIGEDTIRTILSWIVITRILIAHVYTFTYLSNIYPIITWSRPNLLLPWLILSFFKNVVLEVIVIVIGLLLWYGSPFSLVVFLEFIFVKFVPLILASYNWYSNSCLFLQLRQTEKMKKLHRSMRSDSNLLTNQLYVRIDDPKYRTGSLTTLFSYDSYETYNPNLTPGQNAKKLLGITDQDVEDARARIKQTKADRRLTELEDDIYFGDRSVTKGILIGSNIYESELFRQRVSQISTIYHGEKKSEKLEYTKKEGDTSGDSKNNSEIIRELHYAGGEEDPREKKDEEVDEGLEEKRDMEERIKVPETVEVPERSKDSVTFVDLQKIEEEEEVTSVTREVLATKKREGADLVESQRMKQQRTRSPSREEDAGPTTRPKEGVDPTGESVKSVERSSSPVKLQALFNCSCALSDSVSRGSRANSVATTDMKTSTPEERSDDDNEETEETSRTAFGQPYTYTYNVTDVSTDFTMNSGFPLMEKLLKNDLKILKSIKVEEQTSKNRGLDDVAALQIPKEDRSNMFLDGYAGHRNASIDLQNISEIVKDLGVSTKTTSASKTQKYRSDRRHPGNGGAEDGMNRLQNATWRLEEDIMKVFDGLYQNDFANNSELQCALQQMEKKKWNPFSGQTNLETLLTTTFPERNNPPSLIDFWRPEEMCESTGPTSRRAVLARDSQPPKMGTDSRSPRKPSQAVDIPRPVVVNATKDVGTQTLTCTIPKRSNSNEAGRLMDAKPRRKLFRRWKQRAQDQSESARQMTGAKPASARRDHSLVARVRSKSPMLPKTSLNDRMRLTASRSFANKNDCECRMQKLGGKYSPSTDSSFDRREEGCRAAVKLKVDSLATLPLAQAMRKPNANPWHSKKKPPAYPKEAQKDSWRTPSGRIDLLEAKNSVDRQSTNSSRTNKSRNRPRRPAEDQEARELRALKAYNEITLLKDKKELELRKNLGRVAVNRDVRSYKKVASRNDLGKENLSANAASETGYSSRSNKPPPNAAGKSAAVSNERYTSRSAKVVKASGKQKNFDRLPVVALRAQQPHADLAGIGRTAEEIVPSETSDVKLESDFTGRDLDRSKAKEDVRASVASSVEAGRLGSERPSARGAGRDEASRVAAEDLEPGSKELLTLMKKSAKEDAASTLSSGSVDLEATGSSDEEHVHDLPILEEEVLGETHDATGGSVKLVEEEVIKQTARISVDPRSIGRDQEENRGNSLVPASLTWRKRDRNADLWGDIHDNVIPGMLHNFYSHKLMDSLLHDSKMEEFSAFSEQVDRFNASVPAIREAQGLDQARRPLIVYTAAMDRESNIPANLEMESSIDEDGQGLRLDEEQLHDILSSVTEVLRNLNIDETAERRTNDTALEKIIEIFDDVLEDGFQEVGTIPKFIKEDIFTDLKFPIMITAAAFSPGAKTFNVYPLQLRLDRDAEFVEPIGSDLDGLTAITEESEEDAEQAGARGAQHSNFKFALKLASSCEFLESTRVDEFENAVEAEIEEDYGSVVDETFSSSTEYATFIGFAGSKVDLNRTYDVASRSDWNEDADGSSVRIEEIDGSVAEENVCDSGMVEEVDTSMEKTEEAWKALGDDNRGTVDAGIEGVVEELKQIEIGGSVGEADIEPVPLGSEETFGKNFIDKNTEEETEISSRPEETAFGQVEEARGYRDGRNEDRVRRDKHAQEEDVGNEASGEGVLVEEAEESAGDVDVRSSIEIGRPRTSIGTFKEREENVREPPNAILADERNRSTDEVEEICTLEIAPEEMGVAREEMSLMRICMFWLLVFYFYIRHFYRWMSSLTQVDRTTLTLSPFEVHTVSTSTSTLIENAALTNRIRRGLVDEETLETSVNLETVNISRVIEERLRVVLDLTSERSVSRNSEFGLEEMAEELRRETLDLGLSSSGYLAEETSHAESEPREQDAIQHDGQLDAPNSAAKIDRAMEEDSVGETSSSVDAGKLDSSAGEATSATDTLDVEKTRDSSPVRFETTLEDMDSFDSVYTRPSVTTNTVSCADLDGDDMEEFSIASNTSDEPARA